MKINIDEFKSNIRDVIINSPVEVFTALIFFVLSLIVIYGGEQSPCFEVLMKTLFFFFVCIGISYSLNTLFKEKKRFLYYVSPVTLPLIYLYVLSDIYNAFTTVVSSLCVLFFIYVSRKVKNNKEFVVNAQSTTVNLIFTGLLTSLVIAIAFSIILSISLIFDIKFDLSKVYASIVSVGIFLFATFTFLIFERKEKFASAINRLINIIVNYILTPAIFTYGLILYVYFAKIVILWDLPKGVISVTAIVFLAGGILIKACRMVQDNKFMNWFFDYFEYISLPALGMLWVSIVYRISEYGFTTDRVYLLLAVLTFTMWIAAFALKRKDNYKFLVTATIIPFLLFSYMPEIKGRDIDGAELKEKRKSVFLISDLRDINIEGYKNLYNVKSYVVKGEKYYLGKDNKINIFSEDGELIFEESYENIFNNVLQQAGYDIHSPLTAEIIETFEGKQLVYRSDNMMIAIQSIYFNTEHDKPEITSLNIVYIITK